MNQAVSFVIKLYSFMLLLYPQRHREEFSEQMLMDFADMATDAGKRGSPSLFLFCLHEFIDFPINLLRVHWMDDRLFRVLRSLPLSFGIRGAVGFGVLYAMTFPLTRFMYDQLSFIDPFVTRLQVYYYDRFHIENSFEFISRIPYVISLLLMSLILGFLFAILFAEHSHYRRYFITASLGWILHNAIGQALSFNFWVFLEETQLLYFNYMMLAVSGAIWGVIVIVANSEKRDAMRWLAIGVFLYPLFSYLWMKGLFTLFVFRTPLRFVGLAVLVVTLLASLLWVATKLSSRRKFPWIVIAAIFGYPLIGPLAYFVDALVYPPMVTPGTALDSMSISVSNIVYGAMLGLFLGVILGVQKKHEMQQAAA